MLIGLLFKASNVALLILNIISGSALRGSSKVGGKRFLVSPRRSWLLPVLLFRAQVELIGNGGERYQASLKFLMLFVILTSEAGHQAGSPRFFLQGNLWDSEGIELKDEVNFIQKTLLKSGWSINLMIF